MRRISLALALVSAVAAGCSMGSKPSSTTGNGTAKGEQGVYYYVNIFATPVGGKITSNIAGAPAAINCGASAVTVNRTATPNVYVYTYLGNACGTAGQTRFNWADTVVLTATPDTGKVFIGWAGDCKGTGTCTLTNGADKTVVAIFGVAGQLGHINFLEPAVHGPAFASFAAGDTGALQCTACHGEDLGGQGIAPACASCHSSSALTSGGHGDLAAVAWSSHGTGWSASCQRCHTNGGYQDWVGVDGSANYNVLPYTGNITATLTTPPGGAGYANGPLQCATCHNAVTEPSGAGITTITFPASISTPYVQVTTDKVTALCGQCHMARESTVSMNTAIAASLAASDPDAQMAAAGVSFRNPHYRGAAATMFGSVAQGWAQYTGKVYTGLNQHGGAGKCTACHDAHGLEVVNVTATSCGRCHFDETTGAPVTSLAQIEEQRQFGFEGDIDGNGVQAGLKDEILGLNAKLVEAIQAYAFNVAGQGICFDDLTYPYFIKHATATGACTAAELAVASSTGAFKQFTPRLMRAAYNLKFSVSDFAAWAHNPRYAIEVLFDAISDLNAGLVLKGKTPVAFTGKRAFNGHFGAANDPSPYAAMMDLDASGNYGFSAACSQCHGGAVGLSNYLATAPAAVTTLLPDAKVPAFQCATCHAFTGDDMTGLRTVANVYFPPQKGVTPNVNQKVITVASSAMPPGNAVCASCHSARENGATIDMKVGTNTNANWTLSFSNPHYLGAAAMIMGSTTAPMAQYGTNSYSGKAVFWKSGTNGAAPGPHGSPHGAECNGCHRAKESKHTFEVDFAYCGTCHVTTPYGDYRLAPVEEEFGLRSAELYAAIRTAAAYNAASLQTVFANPNASGICYNGNAYPYWFLEVSGACSTTQFNKFNPSLLRAAYNYQWTVKEPGAWAHNEPYVTQVMFDAITDLGGTPSFARPAVTP